MHAHVKKSVVFAALALAADFACAQAYATRPVRFLVSFPPGGATDISARLLAPRLSEGLGQQVIVDNRPGASGMIATAVLARAAPDGHTIMIVDSAHGANPALNDKMPYDTLKDIAGVSLVLRVPLLLSVHPAFPAQSVKELIALAKANPGKYNYGSAGTGSTMYLIAELFKAQAGIDLVHVPYKGGGAALAEVVGGQIPMTFLSTAATLPFLKAGRVRSLGVSGRERSAILPDIPTIAESGLPGFEFYLWQAIIAPAGLSGPMMTRLNGQVNAALNHRETKEQFGVMGVEATPGTPQQADAHIRAEVERWLKTLKPAAR